MNTEEKSAVVMQGDMSDNLLTPGMSFEAVPGRSLVVHGDCRVKDISRYADMPYRHAGEVQLLRLDTFVEFVLWRLDTWGHKVVYVNQRYARAVFNNGSWGDDFADFDFEHTPDWREWKGKDRCWMSQESCL